MLTEIARAKINLTLHVGRAIADMADPFYGYHPLDSLVVFASYGDELSCRPAGTTSLTITGEFGDALSNDENNLILRAYRTVERLAECPTLEFSLAKKLPVAAGIGGGSANAAATLRLLKNYVTLSDTQWMDVALNIGADVPVCFYSQTARMTGIGETVHRLPGMGTVWAVLVNPGISVSTADIYKAFDQKSSPDSPKPQRNLNSLYETYLAGRNDLQPIAFALRPEIHEARDVIQNAIDGTNIDIRMSGSGATVFAPCKDREIAERIHHHITNNRPDWWCVAAELGDRI